MRRVPTLPWAGSSRGFGRRPRFRQNRGDLTDDWEARMGEDLMGDWETAMDEDLISDWGAGMRLMEFESAEGLGGGLRGEKGRRGFLKSGMRAFLRRNSARQNLPDYGLSDSDDDY